MNFEFATATRIIFGPGKLTEIGPIAAQFGKRALVVTGKQVERATSLFSQLVTQKIIYHTFSVADEPTTSLIEAGVEQARTFGCDMVISLGGGSVIDAGKAIAALATNAGNPLDYLEVIGAGKPLQQPPKPFIAIPTTAGTGAEVTRNAVLASPEHQVKVSLRSPLMLPDVALVDPALTYSAPPALTAATGLDALTQVIEPFVSHLANPLTDGLCREGIRRAARSLRTAYEDGQNEIARQDMALASLLGGLALANAKLGAVHGFAGPIGGQFKAPHGAICGRLLPFATVANVNALQAREPDNPALERYAEVAQMLTDDATATIADGVAWLQTLCASLNTPGLATYGLTEVDLDSIVEKSAGSSSMKGNPITLTQAELRHILVQAL